MENKSIIARSVEVPHLSLWAAAQHVQGVWRCQRLFPWKRNVQGVWRSSSAHGRSACARSVEVPASVPRGQRMCAVGARSLAVEVPASVLMGGSASTVQGAWLWRCAGICPCGRERSRCYHCNPNFAKTAAGCSNQCGILIAPKRKVKNGGNGLCSGCEVLLKTEAAVAGSEPPPPNKRWEDVVLDALIPRVLDEHGMKRPYESRDDHRHMLGSNKRRRSGECDTAHQRRPDLLYVVREPVDSRIVAFLSVEVDEDSHCDRDPNCEGGKIDETFQALTQLAQTEGCSKGAAARHDARAPFGLFLKFNPNACDVGLFTLNQRIDVLVKRCNAFLSQPVSFFTEAAIRREAMLPQVETMFYHSNRGNSAAILALLEQSNGSHLRWLGNTCSV